MNQEKTQTDIPVIDFAAHFYPKSALPPSHSDRPERFGQKIIDPDALTEYYDDTVVDAAVLSQPYYMGHNDEKQTAEANDALLDVITEYPDFYGLAAIPVAAGGKIAAEEFERCIANGLHGGGIETKTDGIEIIDPELEPVFEVANRTGAPIFVHPKIHDSLHPNALDDTYRLNAIFGREAALCESISKAIHEGVIERFPNAKYVFHHTGGNIASMLGRVRTSLDAERREYGDGTKNYADFKDQLNKIYLDTSGYLDFSIPLRSAIEELPPTQIVFGTDVPFEPRSTDEIDNRVQTIKTLATESQAQQILWSNTFDILVNTT